MIAKNIKNDKLVIICNNQSVSLLKYFISDQNIISDDFSSLFNIRKDGILKAIKSWFILIRYLQKVNKNDKIYFEKNDFRFKITKMLIGSNLFAPENSHNSIYKKRQLLFDTELPFTYLIKPDELKLINKKIIIFPGSRIKAKEISPNDIQELLVFLNLSTQNVELYYFFNENIPAFNNIKCNINTFDSIKTLINAIESADIIISADSLPLHVTYFLNKPVIPFYNNKINIDWLPIGIGEFVILNQNNKIIFSNKLLDIWKKININ